MQECKQIYQADEAQEFNIILDFVYTIMIHVLRFKLPNNAFRIMPVPLFTTIRCPLDNV